MQVNSQKIKKKPHKLLMHKIGTLQICLTTGDTFIYCIKNYHVNNKRWAAEFLQTKLQIIKSQRPNHTI